MRKRSLPSASSRKPRRAQWKSGLVSKSDQFWTAGTMGHAVVCDEKDGKRNIGLSSDGRSGSPSVHGALGTPQVPTRLESAP